MESVVLVVLYVWWPVTQFLVNYAELYIPIPS